LSTFGASVFLLGDILDYTKELTPIIWFDLDFPMQDMTISYYTLYVLISDKTEEIGRGKRGFSYLTPVKWSYSIIVSYTRTCGIHAARRTFGSQ
jgi:hypothetical protein